MSIRQIVVDTSALVESVDERFPDRGEAFRYLQGTYPMLAPRIIESEAGNVVHAKFPNAFGPDISDRVKLLETLLEGIHPAESSPLGRDRCAEIVEQTGLTFYDSEYLEVADRQDVNALLTEDQALIQAGREVLGGARTFNLDTAADRIAAGEL